jgi:putative transposase
MGQEVSSPAKCQVIHVVLVAQGPRALVEDHLDWERLGEILARALAFCGGRVHAYCCLPGEMHLALELGRAPLDAVIRRLCGPYARFLNRRRRQSGRVFRRYRASIWSSLYLLPLVIHIHLLPERRLHTRRSEYPWSTHHTYLRSASIPWLTTGAVLNELGGGKSGVLAYRQSIHRGEDAEVTALFAGAVRRSSRTIAHGESAPYTSDAVSTARVLSLQQLTAAAANRLRVPYDAMYSRSRCRRLSMARALTAWHAMRCGLASMAEVAAHFDRHRSTLRLAVDHCRMARPELFEESMAQLLAHIPDPR